MIDSWKHYEYVLDSEYARVLNMLGLHMAPKFSIIDISQGFEYASSFEYDSVTQSSVHISRVLNMFGLNIQEWWICQGYTGFSVNCILKIYGILNVSSSEYAKVSNVSVHF